MAVKSLSFSFVAIAVVLFLGGCGAEATQPPLPTLTASPPPSLVPTFTPTSTSTSIAYPTIPVRDTATPADTATPTPSPFPSATPAPTLPAPASIFGSQMARIDASTGLTQALEAGVQWVRRGTLHWDELEPERTDPPTYKWELVDEASFVNAAENGLEVVAVVNLAPDWALQYPGIHCGPIKREALEAYGQFMSAVVARYSQPPYSVRYWEMGNEPDIDRYIVGGHSGFGCWGDVNDEYYGGGYYAEMLKVVYPAIKAADPNAQVILGGLLLGCDPRHPDGCKDATHGTKPSRFLEGLLRNGGGEVFDILGLHAYTYFGGMGYMGNANWPGSDTAVPEKVDFLRGVLAEYGYKDKPMMNTEAALLCKFEWLAEGCRDQQAVYVPRAYADALAEGLVAQLYFGLINSHWWHTGLLAVDLTPRPAYHTYAVASQFLRRAEYVGPAQGYPAGIEGYEFLRPSGRVDLVWSDEPDARPVELAPGTSAYDRFGQLVASSGTIQMDYGPVYVTWP